MTQLGKQQTDLQLSFDRQDEVFGNRAAIQSAYLKHIQQAVESYEGQADVRIAACILEPVLQVTTSFARGCACDLVPLYPVAVPYCPCECGSFVLCYLVSS